MEGAGLPAIQREWQQMNEHMGRLRAERDDALAQRDEARQWCRTMLIIILLLAMALGYVLANVTV